MVGSRLRVEGRVPLGTDSTVACPALSAGVPWQAWSQHVCGRASGGGRLGERGGGCGTAGGRRRCRDPRSVLVVSRCGGQVGGGEGCWESAGGSGGPSAPC